MGKLAMLFLVVGVLCASTVYFLLPHWITDPEPPKIKDFDWWSAGTPPVGAEKAQIASKPFKIEVNENDMQALKKRLLNARYSEPLENCNFNYGFPGDELKKVVHYWVNQFNWTVQVAHLNQYKHYKARIEGLNVHYMRITSKNKNVKVVPLLLIHGWPGSFVEYLKVIPILSKQKDLAFDVICVSIPGFGYSDAPRKMGFNVVAAARVFHKLMVSLNVGTYYVQGTDWGSIIGSAMAVFYPNMVRGLHINFVVPNPTGPRATLNMILGHLNKNWVLEEGQTKSMFPLFEFLANELRETGYLHIQATKPDTIGTGLSDSPVGLAAYILEKFTVFTNTEHLDLPDGGLTKKFALDDLLTNVMVYWTTNSITSSARFYKESFKPSVLGLVSVPVRVPVGISVFPHEPMVITKCMAQDRYRDIVFYRRHSKGGHFPAMEEPDLFAQDVLDFVRLNEALLKVNKN